MTGLPFMGYIALLFLGFGLLASIVGWVMVLVPAFRQHVGWGVATLLVPGAGLIFAVLHWAEARRGFLLQLLGGVILAVGTLAANDGGPSSLAQSFTRGDSEPASTDPESALKLKESEVRAAEIELATLQTKLNADYEALKVRRARLGTDGAALAAFNQDAAAYAAAKTQLSIQAGRVAQLRADQVRLTDQVFLEARQFAKSQPKPAVVPEPVPVRVATPKPVSVGSGDVVMYTTRTCPACVAAKQYFARKGVPYREVDVQNDRAGMEEFAKLGGRSVPLIIVKGRQMVGFNRGELDKLL